MKRIDLGPAGPAGIEAKAWTVDGVCYLYVPGSDSWADWRHHLRFWRQRELELPATREIRAAYSLAAEIRGMADEFVVGGHSLGGAIAEIVATYLHRFGRTVTCYTFGGKRPPGTHAHKATVRYVYRGDIVPALPPWRERQPTRAIGDLTWPWTAHAPDSYEDAMERAGF